MYLYTPTSRWRQGTEEGHTKETLLGGRQHRRSHEDANYAHLTGRYETCNMYMDARVEHTSAQSYASSVYHPIHPPSIWAMHLPEHDHTFGELELR